MAMNHDHMPVGHLGIAVSLARIKRQYICLRLGKKTYVNNCHITCAKRKAYGSKEALLKLLPQVAKFWEK